MLADAKASSYSGAKAGDLIRRYAFDRRYCSIERQGAVFILAWGNGPGSWAKATPALKVRFISANCKNWLIRAFSAGSLWQSNSWGDAPG